MYNTIANSIGNTIGNTIKKESGFSRYPFYNYFDFILRSSKKRANAILTVRFIGTTFVEHRREFIENLQYGKQIGKLLDIENMQKRPQAPKPILLGQESKNSENWIPNFDCFEND